MEQQQILEGNRLIMESVFAQDHHKKWMEKLIKFEGNPDVAFEEARYHDRWDWIMPIVEKIERGNYGFKMCRKVVEIYWDDSKELILKRKEKSRIESLWIAIVDFIQWYNTQPKTDKP